MSTGLMVRERLRRLAAAARASQELADVDRSARDDEIEQADLAGLSYREIAGETGLSAQRVQAIVLVRTAERQQRARQALQL